MNFPPISCKALLGSAVAVSISVGGGTTSSASETINLTAVDGYPPKALQVQTFIEFFIPEVIKRLA